jgi:hypothetical protein
MVCQSREKQVEAIAASCDGVSVRATERLSGVNRGTILSLGVGVGDGCAKLHDAMTRGLHVSRLELEVWSFVAKKQRHLKQTDPADFGDQYVFLALAGAGKAIVSWRVGKRNGENCRAFLAELRARVLGAPEISSDAFPAYPDAVEQAFGIECAFGTIQKHYAVEPTVEAARRYSPAVVVAVTRTRVIGRPSKVSISYIERQNLNAQDAAAQIHQADQCFLEEAGKPCRRRRPIRGALQFLPNPRNSAGYARDAAWRGRSRLDYRELVDAALDGQLPAPPGRRYGRFSVIDGGRE